MPVTCIKVSKCVTSSEGAEKPFLRAAIIIAYLHLFGKRVCPVICSAIASIAYPPASSLLSKLALYYACVALHFC